MGYFAPRIIKHVETSDSNEILWEAQNFCLSILREYNVCPMKESARIVCAYQVDSKEIGSISCLASQSPDIFKLSSFRRIHWRVEWASNSSSLFDVNPCFGNVASVSVQYDFLNETGGPSAEADFKTVARRIAEEMHECLFVASSGYYGSPAAIYFEIAHRRRGNEAVASALPVFSEFHKLFEAKWQGAPPLVNISHSGVDKWFTNVTARLAGHPVKRSWWPW